ncbi:MAG TPA: helix-hairpin-helix domain-containing protein [Bdellovibrionota bacterium]|nr:helix-hairpin-helix domain-containing protein [Bdellovibrionota bacterium]
MKKVSLLACIAIVAVAGCDSRDRRDADDATVMNRGEQTTDTTTTYQQPGAIGQGETEKGSETVVTKKQTTETVRESIPTIEEKQIKADINRLSADEFHKLGLPKTVAENVTKYRSEHGDFKSIDDLSRVPGMSSAWLTQMRGKLGIANEGRG